MRLQLKFAIYNALIKLTILGVLALLLPRLIETISYHYLDRQLDVHYEKLMRVINKGGLQQIIEEDCSYDDYNILKQEFVEVHSLENSSRPLNTKTFKTEEWDVEGDNLLYRVIHTEFIYDNQLYELNIGESIEGITELKNAFMKYGLPFFCIFLVITFFIDLGFVTLVMQPFNKIVSKFKNANDPLKYEPKPINTSTFEFGYMDYTFEELMLDIKNAFNNEKEFIGNVSHELLTPLSIMQSRFENILAEGKVDDDTAVKVYESQKTISRLTKIIRALLMISKIENAQYLRNETVDVKQTVEEVVSELEDRIEQKQLSIQQNLEPHTIEKGNPALMHTMIYNIVNNAIKYNNEKGSIAITLSGRKLIIADTGKGIEKEKLPLIFDRFKRFNTNESNSYGLGLSIVKTIAQFHDIQISVESKENEGTQFMLTLPD